MGKWSSILWNSQEDPDEIHVWMAHTLVKDISVGQRPCFTRVCMNKCEAWVHEHPILQQLKPRTGGKKNVARIQSGKKPSQVTPGEVWKPTQN